MPRWCFPIVRVALGEAGAGEGALSLLLLPKPVSKGSLTLGCGQWGNPGRWSPPRPQTGHLLCLSITRLREEGCRTSPAEGSQTAGMMLMKSTVLVPLLTRCVALGRWLTLSELQRLHLKNQGSNTYPPEVSARCYWCRKGDRRQTQVWPALHQPSPVQGAPGRAWRRGLGRGTPGTGGAGCYGSQAPGSQ